MKLTVPSILCHRWNTTWPASDTHIFCKENQWSLLSFGGQNCDSRLISTNFPNCFWILISFPCVLPNLTMTDANNITYVDHTAFNNSAKCKCGAVEFSVKGTALLVRGVFFRLSLWPIPTTRSSFFVFWSLCLIWPLFNSPFFQHASCYCNGCRLSADYLVTKGGDDAKEEAGGLPIAFWIQNNVQLEKGAGAADGGGAEGIPLAFFKVTKDSKTRRFYCKSCNTYVGMSPEGFPMIGLNTKLFSTSDPVNGQLACRHSLEHT